MAKYYTKDITVTIAGQKKRIKVRGKTQKDLDEKVLEWRIRERNGELTLNSSTTVSVWAKEWMETYKKNTISKKAYGKYESAFKNHINPIIGGLKLKDVKPIDLQRCINTLAGKSNSLIAFHLQTIRALFLRAAKNKLIDIGLVDDIVVPKGTKEERRSITHAERIAFMSTIDKHKYGLMFGMILACGFRPGEVRALTWTNVNFETNQISIINAVKSGTNDVGDPKSKAGVRIVKMPNWYANKFKIYAENKNSLFVFPSGATKGLMTEQHFKRSWSSFKRLMDIEMGATLYRNKITESRIDEKLSPYYLRHTFCTDLAASGVSMKVAQYLMGHATIAMTAQIYTHFEDNMRNNAAIALNEYQTKQVRQKVRHNNNSNAENPDVASG